MWIFKNKVKFVVPKIKLRKEEEDASFDKTCPLGAVDFKIPIFFLLSLSVWLFMVEKHQRKLGRKREIVHAYNMKWLSKLKVWSMWGLPATCLVCNRWKLWMYGDNWSAHPRAYCMTLGLIFFSKSIMLGYPIFFQQ